MIVIIEKLNSLDDRTTFTPASPCKLTESGYVTWSSISCGLRPIQSVKTITWFSERSGIASTGIVSMARVPATPTAIAARITRNRLRIDHSMIDSIKGRPREKRVDAGASPDDVRRLPEGRSPRRLRDRRRLRLRPRRWVQPALRI